MDAESLGDLLLTLTFEPGFVVPIPEGSPPSQNAPRATIYPIYRLILLKNPQEVWNLNSANHP